MSRVVWKYVLAPDANDIQVPAGARFLYATEQLNDVVAYALVEPDQPVRETRRLWVVGTGSDAGDLPDGELRPLGVARLAGGLLMFHVFEVST